MSVNRSEYLMNDLRSKSNKHERIAFINDHLGQGGVGSVNRKLMQYLIGEGYEIYNVTIFEKAEIDGAENHFLNLSAFQAALILPLLFKLFKFFIRTKAQYIISSKDYVNIWVIVAFRLARCKNSKLLVNSHIAVTKKLEMGSKHIQRWSLSCARYLYRFSDLVANVSEEASRDSELYFGLPKVYTLYNGIVTRDEIGKRFACPNHPFFFGQKKVIVACGRLEEQKNYKLMIRAFAKLVGQGADLYLVILGEGSLRNQLEIMIEALDVGDRVSLAGFQPEPRAFMAHCDLFWLTSWFEGFGVVLVEALSVGAPILSVDCPHGPREILQDGRYGKLVKSFAVEPNVHALREAINEPRPDPKRLMERSMDFEISVCADRYMEILRTK